MFQLLLKVCKTSELSADELHNRYGCLDSILLLEFKLASAGVTAVADMNTKCGEVSSFGAELACHYEWKPPTQLITGAQVAFGLLDPSHANELMEKRG